MSISSNKMKVLAMFRRGLVWGIAIMLMLFVLPPAAMADEDDNAGSNCKTVTPAPNGVTQPTGADAATYSFNSCSGLWENQYYTWSPATKVTTPKTPYVYVCDTSTWHWYYDAWMYSPASGKWQRVPFAVSQLPTGAHVASSSPNPCSPAPQLISAPTANQPLSTSSDENSTGRSQTNTGARTLDGSSLAIDRNGNVLVGNTVDSTSSSGSVDEAANTLAGNASTGDATAATTVINNVQSNSSLSRNVVSFTANINGDVQGNLVIDPSQLQPASDSQPLNSTNISINSKDSGTINNSINVNAASGDAKAVANTKAGNVSSGNATAIANVINVLNSIVSAGKSFVGVININGNLHGNILVPQDFLSQLLATNAPHSTMNISSSQAASLGIANQVTNVAKTGNASATGNTSSGNVSSGTADTKVTIFNLTGSQIVGKNCLLVFVNVSGTWVGVIMNAPVGTSAAAIGDGTSILNASNAVVATSTNNAINNNIDVAAASGKATADFNTSAGNVHSGNAQTAVNLLNLNNAQLSLSGWFGVLFINVFGSWYGNFGVLNKPSSVQSRSYQSSSPVETSVYRRPPVFQYVAQSRDAYEQSLTEESTLPAPTHKSALLGSAGHVLGRGNSRLGTVLAPLPVSAYKTTGVNPVQVTGTGLIVAGVATLFVERMLTRRKERQSASEE